MTTIEIDGAIQALQEKKSGLQTDLKDAQARSANLGHEKDSLRSLAIRNGDAEAKRKLDSLRHSLASTSLEASDIVDEIAAVDAEITALQGQRTESAKLEAWAEFLKLASEVERESAAIDCVLFEFFDSLKPHAERLQKLNHLLARADMSVKGFSLELFRRHMEERFRIGFGEYFGKVGRVYHKGNPYEQDYSAIISQRIVGIKQRHDGAVVDEQDEQQVVNE